ncbi:MAG: DNA repair protein RecN, partial [Pseudomonadota bacterium]
MLSTIHIRNFAIIDSVEVEFGSGMNVLTGETGAGKSILIDALGLALGARAASDGVRAGETRAEISASFNLDEAPAAAAWLTTQELDADGECILRRTVGADGRSRAFINGSPVAAQSLRELGDLLIRIHGQNQHQHLQKSVHQRELLDGHGHLTEQRQAVAEAHAEWQAATTALLALQDAQAQREERLAFLAFQIDELETLGLEAGEYAQLVPERDRLANSGQLMEAADAALQTLYDSETANAQALLADTLRAATRIESLDPSFTEAATLLREAEASIGEAAESLRRYLADVDSDPARHEFVEQRVADIVRLARKHQVEPEQLTSMLRELDDERVTLTDADEHLTALANAAEMALAKLKRRADALSAARQHVAERMAADITASMQTLGMDGGTFAIDVTSLESEAPATHGQDRITFQVSANPGQPLQPIARVASGGELSRMSLAIQVAAGRADGVACMIFDEVDAGVGGAVAEMVGKRMRELAGACQVLAVTHLAQVAGQAHHHLK